MASTSNLINGTALAKFREAKGLTQQQLAEEAGCSTRTLIRAEQGDRLRGKLIAKLATILGVLPDELIIADVDRDSIRSKYPDYLRALRTQFRPVKIRGLGHYDDQKDIPLNELFVQPYLSETHLSPDDTPKQWSDLPGIANVLQQHQSVVILGDPGSGKSTLVGHLVLETAQNHATRLSRILGDRLPIPLVLRELQITTQSTLKEILTRFLGRLEAPQVTIQSLHDWLKEGHAFVLLDGLDELPGLEIRKHLRKLVWEAMDQFPNVRWICTSRIVGYEEGAIDQEIEESEAIASPDEQVEPEGAPRCDSLIRISRRNSDNTFSVHFVREFSFRTRMKRFLLAPFDDQQIKEFAAHWYCAREGSKRQGEDIAERFFQAVLVSPATHRLARVPNILTIMVILFRELQVLPDNRALLYSKLIEAYLENIDRARGIAAPRTTTLAEQKLWLGRIAWEIQLRRTATRSYRDKEAAERALLIEHAELVRWIQQESERQQQEVSTEEIEQMLDFLQKRAGLLLERGVRTYAFAHLSFVEYFAAFFLLQNLTDWLLEADESPDEQTRITWTADVRWHEVLIFAFEEIQQQNPRLGKRLWSWLFPDFDPARPETGLAVIQHTKPDSLGARDSLSNQLLLLSRLTEDRATGCGGHREAIVDWCCRWGWKENCVSGFGDGNAFFSQLLRSSSTSESRAEILRQIGETSQQGVTRLNLNSAPVSDLTPLQGLKQLLLLYLDGTGVTDLTPLQGYKQLQRLVLNQTVVTDLAPLQGLTQLQELSLAGTGVTDLTPLRGLTQLRDLFLNNTAVTDLTPLQGLTQLQWLILNETAVTNLSPIQHLIDRGLKVVGP